IPCEGNKSVNGVIGGSFIPSAVSGQKTGLCVACKMALMSVQDYSQPNESEKLYNACTYMEDLRAVCKRFVKKHLQELIKGLKTNEDVETICINAKACKPDLMMTKPKSM
uniref:Saposin B-type domain-containing protein n=1 Tax=Gouania willdenowi TaxID=441366 RepID=A0A8C5GV08_GOUWI